MTDMSSGYWLPRTMQIGVLCFTLLQAMCSLHCKMQDYHSIITGALLQEDPTYGTQQPPNAMAAANGKEEQ